MSSRATVHPGLPFGREEQLLILCASANVDSVRRERIEQLLEEGPDWTRFVNLARRNSVLPLVWHHLKNARPDLVPTPIRNSLADYYKKNAARNILLAGELVEVLDELASNGIETMPYKGPALAMSIYGSLALRQFADLDILVREKDVEKASVLLTGRGYKPEFDLSPRKLTRLVRLSYVLMFQRDCGQRTIELHWKISPRFLGFELSIDELWPRLQSTVLLGRTVLCPSPEDHLLILCVHGIKDCWVRLEWLAAVAQLINNHEELDWDLLAATAKETRSLGILVLGLYLSHLMFETTPPWEVKSIGGPSVSLKRVAEDIVKRFFDLDSRVSGVRRFTSQLLTKDAHSERFRYAFRLATDATPFDWALVPLPSSLGFAYSVLRPFRLARKHAWTRVRKPRSIS
jgi:hypothetical protein